MKTKDQLAKNARHAQIMPSATTVRDATLFLEQFEALAKPLWGVLQERSQNTEDRIQNNRTR